MKAESRWERWWLVFLDAGVSLWPLWFALIAFLLLVAFGINIFPTGDDGGI